MNRWYPTRKRAPTPVTPVPKGNFETDKQVVAVAAANLQAVSASQVLPTTVLGVLLNKLTPAHFHREQRARDQGRINLDRMAQFEEESRLRTIAEPLKIASPVVETQQLVAEVALNGFMMSLRNR